MADVEFEGFDGRMRDSEGVMAGAGRLLGVAGALTSVALVIGLGYWGYRLAVRDVTGIPVVRALEGPMRIAPEDPGGQIASNQGLSVNAIVAEGATPAPADRLVLAPQEVGVLEEDEAGSAVASVASVSGRGAYPPARPSPAIAAAAELKVKPAEPAVQTLRLEDGTDIAALAEALTAGATPLSGESAPGSDAGPQTRPSLPKGALAESPRPRPRPSGVVLASAPVAPEINGESLVSGTRLVQLGAFDSEEIARKEWDRLAGKFGDLIAGKTRIVQPAQSGGRTFYRLRAMGFADEADSRRFCSALVAERAACIPVAVR